MMWLAPWLALSFPGLSPAVLAGSLGLAALVTIGLYLLRLRRRPVVVAYLPLWESLLVDKKASAWRSRLQRLLSLLLSLLLVFSLIFALSDPKTGNEQNGRSVVVVLDVSATMGQADATGATRLSLAKDRIKTWLPSFVDGDELLLMEMGARPRVVSAFSEDMSSVEKALAELVVLDVRPDVEATLDYAVAIVRDRTRAQIIFVSDDAARLKGAIPQKRLPPVSFESVAPAAPPPEGGLAISSFSARRYPLSADRFEVLLEVVHFGEGQAEIEVAFFAADDAGSKASTIDVTRVMLRPGERRSLAFENLAYAREGIIAEARYVDGRPEALLADNVARARLAPRLDIKVLVVGKPNTFLDAALLVEDSFLVTRVSAQAYPPSEPYDVTIFDGTAPARSERTGPAIYLGVPAESATTFPVKWESGLTMFGFDTWKKDSAVFRLIDPYDVQVLMGAELFPEPLDTVLAQSSGRPIFVQGQRPEGRFLALGFSPTQSDFVLRAVWPLFVVNMIDELVPRGRGTESLGFMTGTVWRPSVPVEAEERTARILGPLATEQQSSVVVPVRDGRAVYFGQRAGFYEARTSQGATRFAVSSGILDEDAKQANTGDDPVPGTVAVAAEREPLLLEVSGMEPRTSRDPWYLLVLFVAVASFLEWWSFHRRWTI